MLDQVWRFLRDAPGDLSKDGHNVMLYEDDLPTVEVGVRASVGFASKTGPRKNNEDFAGALIGAELPEPRQEVIAAIADGIGGAKGGRRTPPCRSAASSRGWRCISPVAAIRCPATASSASSPPAKA